MKKSDDGSASGSGALRAMRLKSCVLAAIALLSPARVLAQDEPGQDSKAAKSKALVWEAEYVADAMAVADGPATGTRYLDYWTLGADLSLDRAIGWQGARLFVHGIASLGSQVNDLGATLEGIDNIEAPDRRAKLYEAYLEQDLAGGAVNLRLGLTDLNGEFYVTDSAGLLLAPPFGIGSEIAATGPAGPSIFPSTALAARIRYQTPSGAYAQIGVYNAEAGVPGDVGGIRPLFDQGALLIGEVGASINGKLAVGGWTYTRKQDDIRLTTPLGDPEQRKAYGVYALLDQRIAGGDERGLNFFARAGVSDGRTSPFTGGWQAGLLQTGVWGGRPDSQLSFGVHQAFLSRRYRDNDADLGIVTRGSETALELTYSDKLAPWLTVQPDVQYIWNGEHDGTASHTLVFGFRLRLSAASE